MVQVRKPRVIFQPLSFPVQYNHIPCHGHLLGVHFSLYVMPGIKDVHDMGCGCTESMANPIMRFNVKDIHYSRIAQWSNWVLQKSNSNSIYMVAIHTNQCDETRLCNVVAELRILEDQSTLRRALKANNDRTVAKDRQLTALPSADLLSSMIRDLLRSKDDMYMYVFILCICICI